MGGGSSRDDCIAAYTLHEAIDKLCRDSLESSSAEVRKRIDDGEITVALQTVMFAADALRVCAPLVAPGK